MKKAYFFVFMVFVLFGVSCDLSTGHPVGTQSFHYQDMPEPGGDQPLHVCYDGTIYVFRGEVVYELPSDFSFAATTANVGNRDKAKDFESNNHGEIYLSFTSREILIFKWDDWNEADNGPEPYLLLFPERD